VAPDTFNGSIINARDSNRKTARAGIGKKLESGGRLFIGFSANNYFLHTINHRRYDTPNPLGLSF